MKTEVLKWDEFMAGRIVPVKENKMVKVLVFTSTATLYIVNLPKYAFAASGSWGKILSEVMEIADWLCTGVIIFAGATWMFGNRTKAIELLIGAGAGFEIILHAEDIKNWLKGV